jgi:hypothetical protein
LKAPVSEKLSVFFQRPQLVKGNMQLFSVEQQRSQALEAHAASFASFKVCLMLNWNRFKIIHRLALNKVSKLFRL